MRWTILVLLAGCASGPKPAPAPGPAPAPVPAPAPAPEASYDWTTVDDDWWLAKGCPPGATFRGDGPPTGRKAWCEDAEGRQHGPYTMWFADGERGLQGSYKAGALHGPWTRWYENGQIEQTGAYVDGKPAGEWLRYHDNGQLASRGGYEDGNEHGTWEYFDADGNAVRVEQWRRGELISPR